MGSGEHILFIDDDPRICRSGRKMIESLGYRVTTITDSRTVEKKLQDQTDGIDLVITDMNMPYLNGLDVAKTISLSHPDIPLILMTGLHQDESLATMLGEKPIAIAAILRKPFEKDQLSRFIRDALPSQGE